MLLDSKLAFVLAGSPLSLVAAAGVAIPSPGVIDLLGSGVGNLVTNITGNAAEPGQADAMGMGNMRPELVVAMGTAATTATSATLTIALQGAPDDGTGNPGTWQTFEQSPAYTAAQLTAGQILMRLPWVPPFPDNERPRFLRLLFSVPTATDFTAGTIAYAQVTQARDDNFHLQAARNYTVRGITAA